MRRHRSRSRAGHPGEHPPKPGSAGAAATRRRHRGRFPDTVAVLAAVGLACLGIANLTAMGSHQLARHQAVSVAVGLVALVAGFWLPVRRLPIVAWTAYAATLLMLGLVVTHGVSAYGAQRWLTFGGYTFQPSELAKLSLVLVLAVVVGSARPAWQRFTLAVVVSAVPIVLTVTQPDLSTATVLASITVTLLILGRVPMRFLLPVLGGVVVAAPLGIGLLAPYQLERLTTFIKGTQSSVGVGWAIHQAHIAIASGGWFGIAGTPMHHVLAQYLPSRETDLALAALVESFGFVAAVAAIVATLLIVWRAVAAGRVTRHRQGGLVCAGFAVLLGTQTAISVGGNLGLLPLAGVPFPLLSYGGTAAIVTLAGLGIVLGTRRDGVLSSLWAAPRWASPRPRLARAMALGVTVVLAALSAFGYHLQSSSGANLQGAGRDQSSRCFPIPAERGTITDRHGVPLAAGVPRADVVAIPSLLLRDHHALRRLAVLTGERPAKLRHRLTKAGTALQTRVAVVSAAKARRIATARLADVVVTPVPRRVYPYGPLLAPVLGYVGVATADDVARLGPLPPGTIVGHSGIEQQYDALLRGVDGRQCVFVDPVGKPVSLAERRPPVRGVDVHLTIDLSLQKALTHSLAVGMSGSLGSPRGDIGGAVAMDPRTGAVLALASLPAYDDNVFGPPVQDARLRRAMRAPAAPMLEHATQVAAPPGSTFKLVIASADVAHPVLSPRTVVPTGASFSLGGHTFHNWADLGPMAMREAIAMSNDVYFYKLAWALGADRITSTASRLGVGRPTGIDLPGESSGFLGTPSTVGRIGAQWYGGSTVLLGIGQGYLTVTPLQNALWTAGVGTGNRVTPHLGLSYGIGTRLAPLPWRRPVRLPFAARLGPVRDGMREAVTGGTAALLSNLPVPVAAKTGTAEDATAGKGANDSWLTALAPAGRPEVVMTSYVHGGGHGAQTSGPVVDRALAYFLAHRAHILAVGPRG